MRVLGELPGGKVPGEALVGGGSQQALTYRAVCNYTSSLAFRSWERTGKMCRHRLLEVPSKVTLPSPTVATGLITHSLLAPVFGCYHFLSALLVFLASPT